MKHPSGRWLAAIMLAAVASTACAASRLEQVREFEIPEAYQGVGVDDRYFYAVHNQIIARYDKRTGKPAGKWQGPKDGPILHLDSALVMDGRIYAAHSNYPEWPMTSSVEIFDADTIEHVGSHSFGIRWGSLTWMDWHDGHWWMTFANYDQRIGPGQTPYGGKENTVVVELTADLISHDALPVECVPIHITGRRQASANDKAWTLTGRKRKGRTRIAR